MSAASTTLASSPPSLMRLPVARSLVRGVVLGYLSLIVLIPLSAILWRSSSGGLGTFWSVVTQPESISSLELTVSVSAIVAAINAAMGTCLAWVLVRDRFPGRALVDAVVDLPFALPTIVAGITLLALYGPSSPIGVSVAYTRAGVGLALLFITLPFVVRSVQPVLLAMDRDMEEAAASLGASRVTTFRRIILPNLLPAILSGTALGFSRSMGEFGSVVLISGNLPLQTEVSSVRIYGLIGSNDLAGAAALSVVLLAVSLAVLILVTTLLHWSAGRDR